MNRQRVDSGRCGSPRFLPWLLHERGTRPRAEVYNAAKKSREILRGNFAGCLFSILYCLFYLNLNTCPGLRVEVRLMPLRLQMRLMDTPLRMEMCERVSPLRTR